MESMTIVKLILHVFKFCLVLMFSFTSDSVKASDIRVYAAASLTDALTELSRTYEKTHPDVSIKTSFAGSSTLAKQIENGAPADIFISADKDWGDYLEKRGLLNADSRKDLLSNELVLIAPAGSQLKIKLEKGVDVAVAFSGKLCTGEPAYVPVGKYARQALEYFGWWEALQPRLVGTEDVRTALAFVERGECALGIVYNTDAKMSKKTQIIAHFPAGSHLPVVYPCGLTKNAVPDAEDFWQFLQSDAAKDVFVRYGFKFIP